MCGEATMLLAEALRIAKYKGSCKLAGWDSA
jgi:hypothetical protein